MNRLGEATWRSGYAADCKSVYSGSIPDVASNHRLTLLPLLQSETTLDKARPLSSKALESFVSSG